MEDETEDRAGQGRVRGMMIYLCKWCLWMRTGTHFLVKGVRECFSYRQCLRYLTQRLQVGMALLHLDLRRRHSLQAWSAKPRGVSRSPNPAPRLKDKSDGPKSPWPSEKVVSAEGELSSMVIEMCSRDGEGRAVALEGELWRRESLTRFAERSSGPAWIRPAQHRTHDVLL